MPDQLQSKQLLFIILAILAIITAIVAALKWGDQ